MLSCLGEIEYDLLDREAVPTSAATVLSSDAEMVRRCPAILPTVLLLEIRVLNEDYENRTVSRRQV